MKYAIDDKLYSVSGPNGYRKAWFTLSQAHAAAKAMREQMARNGWRGKVRIYYRDGTEIAK